MLIKIMTWNLGSGIYDDSYYKGTKRNAFFKYKTVINNIKGQIKIIKDNDCDILLLQEVSKFNSNNCFINQYKKIRNNLLNYSSCFSNNKPLLKFIIEGKATFSRLSSSSKQLYIPYKANNIKDDVSIANKNQIITRIKINNKELVIFNIHLAPCKRLKYLRDNQLEYIFSIVNKEIHNGNYVILGGDFNMDILSIKSDLTCSIPNTPTNRDLNNKYTECSKMYCYDGFMYSNNIKLNYIKSTNNFNYSDHCPVTAEFDLNEKI